MIISFFLQQALCQVIPINLTSALYQLNLQIIIK